MECNAHGKQGIGSCPWCGKLLCKSCDISDYKGQRYCQTCAENLAPAMKNRELEMQRREQFKRQQNEKFRRIIERY